MTNPREVEIMDSRRKILEMLADKKITVDEADRLIAAVSGEKRSAGTGYESDKAAKSLKYLRVLVKPGPGAHEQHDVNIRVPLALLRAGMKFASVVPSHVHSEVDAALREKGIYFDWKNIKPENVEELIGALQDVEIDVHGGEHKVQIYAE
jgi:hypothetical protein